MLKFVALRAIMSCCRRTLVADGIQGDCPATIAAQPLSHIKGRDVTLKTPLQYQLTEYDCGPVCVENALRALFERAQIPPELPKCIWQHTLDTFGRDGTIGKHGTSKSAMQSLAALLDDYGRQNEFPIATQYLQGKVTDVANGSRIVTALESGGVAVARVMYGCPHYVLLTGAANGKVTLFNPYLRLVPYRKRGIEMLTPPDALEYAEKGGEPANRRVDFAVLDDTRRTVYALGPREKREVVLLFNTTATPQA